MIEIFDSLQIIYPLLTAFLVTVVITPVCIWIVKKMGLWDDPNVHKHPGIIHTLPIPRGGGIPLFIGTGIAAIFFLPWNHTTTAVFFAAFLALAIGIIDDKLNSQAKDVSPYLRFLINILCAVIVVGSGVTISFITNPFGPGIIHLDTLKIPFFFFTISASQIISIVWIIWVMNMLNWSKGIDGQMPGIVAISSIVIGLLSLRFTISGEPTLVDARLAFILAGSCLGFLLFNFPGHSRIFPGYGATAIYLLLAVVSILSGAKLATAILVMGVPTVDALFTIIRRLLARRSPFLGDKRHLHHLLLNLGYSQRQVALFYWAISAILGVISLTIQSSNKFFAIMMLVVIVGMGLFFLHFVTHESDEKTTS